MLTFKWYAKQQDITVRIPAFEQDYRYIKTLRCRCSTPGKNLVAFRPLRLTFRVLYNLDPVDSDQVFINVDDKTTSGTSSRCSCSTTRCSIAR